MKDATRQALDNWMQQVVDGETYRGYELDKRRKYVRVCVVLANQQLSAYGFLDPKTGDFFASRDWKTANRHHRFATLPV